MEGPVSVFETGPKQNGHWDRDCNQESTKIMKEGTITGGGQKKSQSKKRPLDPREYPLARDAKGSSRREEIRSKTPMDSAPRKSRRSVERSNQKRVHTQ
jgi:hypothetical protein